MAELDAWHSYDDDGTELGRPFVIVHIGGMTHRITVDDATTLSDRLVLVLNELNGWLNRGEA